MPKLFDLFVEFSQKGAQAVSAAMQDLQQQSAQLARGMQGISDRQLALAAQAAQTLARQTEQAAARVRLIEDMVKRGAFKVMAEQIGQALAPTLQALSRASTVAAASLSGLVLSGVRASAWGQLFGFEMERLARVVAGLFAPEIDGLYRALSRLTDALASLTEEQRESIAHTIQAIAAFKVFTSLTAVLLPVLGGLGAAAVGLTAGLIVSEDGVSGLIEVLRPLYDLLQAAAEGLRAVGVENLQTAVKVGIVVAAVGTAVTVVGKLVAVYQALAAAVRAANAAIIVSHVVSGAGLAKLAVGLAAAAGTIALLKKFESDLTASPAVGEAAAKVARGEAPARASGPESIEATYLRIAQKSALIGAGKVDPQEKANGLLEEIKKLIEKAIEQGVLPKGAAIGLGA